MSQRRVRYEEDFNDGPGGWVKTVDNFSPPAALPIRNGVLHCEGPWWVDYNHAPPGGGYLQLLMCLYTRGGRGEAFTEAGGVNRFEAGRYPTDFTNARITVRLAGEVEPADAAVHLLIQGTHDGRCSGWVLTGQPIPITPAMTDVTITALPDPAQWTSLGARHDRGETYAERPLKTVLADVNCNVYLVFFPVRPRPMGPIAGDPHRLRAGRDYPVWPSSITQGYVDIDSISIDFDPVP